MTGSKLSLLLTGPFRRGLFAPGEVTGGIFVRTSVRCIYNRMGGV